MCETNIRTFISFWRNNKTTIWTRQEKELVKNHFSLYFTRIGNMRPFSSSAFLCKKHSMKNPYTNVHLPSFSHDTGHKLLQVKREEPCCITYQVSTHDPYPHKLLISYQTENSLEAFFCYERKWENRFIYHQKKRLRSLSKTFSNRRTASSTLKTKETLPPANGTSPQSPSAFSTKPKSNWLREGSFSGCNSEQGLMVKNKSYNRIPSLII